MDYDSRYSGDKFYWGLNPHHLVVSSINYLPKGANVLDLGCGEGKDSLFLAKNNFGVTAIDISKEGIRKLNEISKKENLKINSEVSEIKTYLRDCEKFEAIFGLNILQFIDDKNILEVIKNIKSKTMPNGLNVIASFIAENSRQKEMALSKGRYLFSEGELREIYKDWNIIFYEEKLGEWETHGESKHQHFTVKMIAKKL